MTPREKKERRRKLTGAKEGRRELDPPAEVLHLNHAGETDPVHSPANMPIPGLNNNSHVSTVTKTNGNDWVIDELTIPGAYKAMTFHEIAALKVEIRAIAFFLAVIAPEQKVSTNGYCGAR